MASTTKAHVSLYLEPGTVEALDAYAAENALSKSVAADRLIAEGIAGARAGEVTSAALAPMEEMMRRVVGDHLALLKGWIAEQQGPILANAQVGRLLTWYLLVQLYGEEIATEQQDNALATVAHTLGRGGFYRARVKKLESKGA